jgi:hypothetical protein
VQEQLKKTKKKKTKEVLNSDSEGDVRSEEHNRDQHTQKKETEERTTMLEGSTR